VPHCIRPGEPGRMPAPPRVQAWRSCLRALRSRCACSIRVGTRSIVIRSVRPISATHVLFSKMPPSSWHTLVVFPRDQGFSVQALNPLRRVRSAASGFVFQTATEERASGIEPTALSHACRSGTGLGPRLALPTRAPLWTTGGIFGHHTRCLRTPSTDELSSSVTDVGPCSVNQPLA